MEEGIIEGLIGALMEEGTTAGGDTDGRTPARWRIFCDFVCLFGWQGTR